MLLAIAIPDGELPALGHASTEAWLSIAYLALVGSIVAFSAYSWLLQHAPVSKVATYAYVNPGVAVALGAAFLGEDLPMTTILGTAIIVASVATIVRTESPLGELAGRNPVTCTGLARRPSTTGALGRLGRADRPEGDAKLLGLVAEREALGLQLGDAGTGDVELLAEDERLVEPDGDRLLELCDLCAQPLDLLAVALARLLEIAVGRLELGGALLGGRGALAGALQQALGLRGPRLRLGDSLLDGRGGLTAAASTAARASATACSAASARASSAERSSSAAAISRSRVASARRAATSTLSTLAETLARGGRRHGDLRLGARRQLAAGGLGQRKDADALDLQGVAGAEAIGHRIGGAPQRGLRAAAIAPSPGDGSGATRTPSATSAGPASMDGASARQRAAMRSRARPPPAGTSSRVSSSSVTDASVTRAL